MSTTISAVFSGSSESILYGTVRPTKKERREIYQGGNSMSPYECGMEPIGDTQGRFSVKFYLVAMLFILFDIEAIFLYPWAVVYRELLMSGFIEMLIFVVLILSGFFYIWKKGALDWSGADTKRK